MLFSGVGKSWLLGTGRSRGFLENVGSADELVFLEHKPNYCFCIDLEVKAEMRASVAGTECSR